ncbi:MAG: hypothetical protein JW869_08255 [Candidatus Omnitrophica bacterium]|nr:hypothetical protein [Candidatus Omnitrophota bacterium]
MPRFKIYIIALIFSIFFTSCAFALEEQSTLGARGLVIRQARHKVGSICVSGPVALDEQIADTIIFNNINSLEDYLQWLGSNIKYEKDAQDDHWAAPQETLNKKYADCEDYAFLNQAVLRVMGYNNAQVLAMGGFGLQHAICVFEKQGCYWWIDNTRLKKTSARSLKEFARHIFNECGSSYLLAIDFDKRDWDILFKRSTLLGKE